MILSMTITFVKSQCDDTTWMEFIAIFDSGQIREKRVPIDGRVLRVDAAFFLSEEEKSA